MNSLDPAPVDFFIDIKIEVEGFIDEFVRIRARIWRWFGLKKSLGPADLRVAIISTISYFLNRALMKMSRHSLHCSSNC